MDVRILGPIEVVAESGSVPLPRGRGRSLLALLVLHAGEVISADRLVDELWGESPPPTAHKGLHNLIAGLRRRLGPGVLVTSGSGYALAIDRDGIDAHRFRRLLEDAAGAPAPVRSGRLRDALALWRGPALADVMYEAFAQAEIAALEELRVTAIEDWVEVELALGRHAAALGDLTRLVAEHPFRERLRAQLMVALYRCGRRADALDCARAGRRALMEELGIEPGPGIVDLERSMMERHPGLDLAGASADDGVGIHSAIEAEQLLAAERKTVTVAFVELVDATTVDGEGDPERLRDLRSRCVAVASAIVDRRGGTVEGVIGGVLVAVFGLPAAHEDDAHRAVGAAVEIRDAVTDLQGASATRPAARLAVGVGINTGEIIVAEGRGGPTAASGDAVQLASRLQHAAGEGEVLLGEATRQLLGGAAEVESVGRPVLDRRGRPAAVWRLVALRAGAGAVEHGVPETLIGRDRELTRLHAAVKRTIRQGRASRLAVVGEAGIGKSTLARAFAQTLSRDVEVLSCRCPAHGDGAALLPLRELVLQAARGRGPAGTAAPPRSDEAERIAGAVAAALGPRADPEHVRDLFPTVRGLFEALARGRPVVVVVDDAQWAQPTFVDLIGYLADAVEAPLLIVCLGRPELLEQRRDRVADRTDSRLVLEPLAPVDSERLVVDRLAGRLVPDGVVSQIVEMARGNPLFIEQLLASLRDQGTLRFPPSIHALLAARLDRLGPAERLLLRCAAVIGAEFSEEALRALLPGRAHPFVARHLDALRRKELISPSRRCGGSFTFRHSLVEQAAYRSATREARAELHVRLADWLEGTAGPDGGEVVAHHLERAHAHRCRLGLDDEATRGLAGRAGERLADAGLRAYARFDMTAAESLLSRAQRLLPADHPQRYDVLRRLSEVYPTLGRLSDAEAVLTEMLEAAREPGDVGREQRLELERLRVRMIAGPDPVRHERIRSRVVRAVEVLEPLGDEVGLSQACYVLAMLHLRSGRLRDLEEAGARGLEHAQRSGDLRELLGALWWPAWALVAGTTPVPEAIASAEELMRLGRGRHVGVMTDLARLLAMRGDFGRARELADRAQREVVERVRVRRALTVVAHRRAEIETMAGDARAAERALRHGIEVALDVDERDQTALIAADLSRAFAARGARREAASFVALARRHAPAESVAAQAAWRSAESRAALLAGAADESARFAEEALGHVPDTMLNLRAGLQLDLAEALLLGGQERHGRARAREAADLYGRKGNLVGGRRARELTAGRRPRGPRSPS